MPKYLLLNGPAGVGKDTLGAMAKESLNSSGYPVKLDKFSAPLKSAVAAFLGLSPAEFEYYFETPEKEKPQTRFCGVTPRQALINFSEDYAKPTFGEAVFAKACLERNKNFEGIVIITDCGFTIEANTIFDAMGRNAFLVCLEREGLTFEGDSREYVARPHGYVDTGNEVGVSLQQLMVQVNTWLKG